jgi:membrane-associated phospholipid phosphatase
MRGSRSTSTPHPEETALHDGRVMRIALLLIAGYLFLGLMPILRWSAANHRWAPLGLQALALAAAAVFGLGDFPRKVRPIRDWLPMALIPFMYFQHRFIVGGIGMVKKDGRIAALDRQLFNGDLWSSLAQSMPSVAVSEFLHLSYISYYPLIAIPPLLLWIRNRRHEFTMTIITLVIAYLICFSMSVAIPVDGPRFVHGPAAAPTGPLRGLALAILKLFSSRGSAFPSSHVAAAIAASYCALRYQRKIGYVAAVLTVGLALGAIYGGLHYATDIIAGTGVGFVAILIARRLERAPAAQPVASVKGAPRPRISGADAPVKVQVMQARMAQHHARKSRSLRTSQEVDVIPPPDGVKSDS